MSRAEPTAENARVRERVISETPRTRYRWFGLASADPNQLGTCWPGRARSTESRSAYC